MFEWFSGATDPPTLETIDSYMSKLYCLSKDSNSENEAFLSKAKQIIANLTFDTN